MTNHGERIRALASGNAVFYRLKVQLADGTVRVFPPEDGAYYKVGETPHHVSAGSYLLCFYDAEQRPLVQHDQTFLVHSQAEVLRNPQAQLPLNFQLGGSPGPSGPPSTAFSPVSPPAPAAATAAPAIAPAVKPSEAAAATEADLEFRKYLHAMDLEERQQDFIRNSTYVKEVGELFLLNRLMRRDMMMMQRDMVLHSHQAFANMEQVHASIQGLLTLQSKVLDHVDARLKVPPAPPPDYVGLGNSAIAMLRDIGVALIQRGQPERAPAPSGAPPQTPPQLPAPSAALSPDSAPAAETARPPDAIERIGKRLRSLTELELAQAMSSPEAWAALLQSCMKPEAPPEREAKEPSPKPEIGVEG